MERIVRSADLEVRHAVSDSAARQGVETVSQRDIFRNFARAMRRRNLLHPSGNISAAMTFELATRRAVKKQSLGWQLHCRPWFQAVSGVAVQLPTPTVPPNITPDYCSCTLNCSGFSGNSGQVFHALAGFRPSTGSRSRPSGRNGRSPCGPPSPRRPDRLRRFTKRFGSSACCNTSNRKLPGSWTVLRALSKVASMNSSRCSGHHMHVDINDVHGHSPFCPNSNHRFGQQTMTAPAARRRSTRFPGAALPRRQWCRHCIDQPPFEQKMRLHDDSPEYWLDQRGHMSFNNGRPSAKKHGTIRATGVSICRARANFSNSNKASGSGLPWDAITNSVSSAGTSTRPAIRLLIPQSREFRHLGLAADVRSQMDLQRAKDFFHQGNALR